MKKNKLRFIFSLTACICIMGASSVSAPALGIKETAKQQTKTEDPDYFQPYLNLLRDVYEKMNESYFIPVSEQTYRSYVQRYKESVLRRLPAHTARVDAVAYRGAGLLVYALRAPYDTFTNFIPPQKTEEYKQEVYGYGQDIGITGSLTTKGFLIDHVEIRSDSYEQGIRDNDIIMRIEGRDVLALNEEEIAMLLAPQLGSSVSLAVFSRRQNKTIDYTILSKEYFKETVKNIPTNVKDIYCLKVERFNQKTSDDIKDYLREFKTQTIKGLVLDLRDNPGGPPLAVHELSGIFLPAQSKLFYYKKKNIDEFGLIAPSSEVSYDGPLIILVNKKSGSASELLAATFQAYQRALVMGKEPTAGQAFLKSKFDFEDGSMLVMITGFAYLFNGVQLGLDGVQPNITIPEDVDQVLEQAVLRLQKTAVAEEKI